MSRYDSSAMNSRAMKCHVMKSRVTFDENVNKTQANNHAKVKVYLASGSQLEYCSSDEATVNLRFTVCPRQLHVDNAQSVRTRALRSLLERSKLCATRPLQIK